MDTSYAARSESGEPFVLRNAFSASPALASWVPGSVEPTSSSSRGRDADSAQPHKPPHDRRRFTVLIVDDDDSIAELLADLLEGEGYGAVVAHDGVSALEYARTKRPDMVLSDCMMPGLSGTQLAQELRRSRATRSIALVLMSSTRPRDLNLAHVPFLPKPFEIDEVLALVQQYSQGPVSSQLYGEG
jgi:CheY-like chemotaxis protein